MEIYQSQRGKKDKIGIGTFNHSRKLSFKCISLFAKIIKEIEGSELVLKSISFIEKEEQDRIYKLFMNEGITPDQIRILPWVEGRENHLNCYEELDIALDPFPYGGATTTCEALAMGVPVVSMHGEGMVGALSASILNTANLNELVAKTEEEYIQITKNLFSKGKLTENKREELREYIMNSELNKPQILTTQLEEVYRKLAISTNA